ncbi:uncharacterized protein LOC120414087 [Culex pipiens pallens]|uniref:uncharacterized protein LOC120414087 n=1 Tax=Culex pipiens pallens TaxID=42434 RepID=UPI0022AA51E2|nr:uncharacterized protein LOC120414087 [Culex pipiens pallens]
MSQTSTFKSWQNEKLKIENDAVTALSGAFNEKDLKKFEACLRSGNEQLLRVYNQIPDSKKISAEEKVRRNHKLLAFFRNICRSKQNSENQEEHPMLSNSIEPTSTQTSEANSSPKPKWQPLKTPEWMNVYYLLYRLLSPTIIVLATLCLIHHNNAVLSVLILLSGIDNIIHFKLLPSTTLSSSIIMLETVSRSLLKSLLCVRIEPSRIAE